MSSKTGGFGSERRCVGLDYGALQMQTSYKNTTGLFRLCKLDLSSSSPKLPSLGTLNSIQISHLPNKIDVGHYDEDASQL